MRDGSTERIDRSVEPPEGIAGFLGHQDIRLVAVSGDHAGGQFRARRERHLLGRGPGVDFQVDDPAMSRQHAALEYADGAFRIRDLGSTNGLLVNGRPVQVAELENGDRIELGSHVFQYVIDVREEEPEVYELSPEE